MANDTKGSNGKAGWIALAAIAATAIVGVAGAATSWLNARDDRATQRGLAHDARIFDARSAAYVDALVLIDKQETQLLNLTTKAPSYVAGKDPPVPLMLDDAGVLARIRAYSSVNALAAYMGILDLLGKFYRKELVGTPRLGFDYETDFRDRGSVFQKAVRDDLR